jgi:methionyl aminopeptidase
MKDNVMRKLSRNDPCWCGSGKKYKKCHLQSDLAKELVEEKGIKPPPGVIVKTDEQVKGIRESCKLSKRALDLVEDHIRPGITTDDINTLVHEFITSNGAVPAPLNYNGFPKSVCTSPNSVICHGIPDNTVLKEGDILNVDVTSILNGYYGDTGRMYFVGEPSKEARKIVETSKECLNKGIEMVKPYNDIGEIGYAIEQYARKLGYTVVRDYGGHGVGVKFHEEPHIHHYGTKKRGIIMVPNMVFTIEPMINQGRYESKLLSDGWTAVTIDDKLSAQWEHTVLVTEEGVEILTA